MANLVNLENVGKSFGTTTVLDAVSLGIADDDRIGVVGRNGGGKSTLLHLILGVETPDTGRVTRTGGVSVAAVGQRGRFASGASVRSAVVGDAAEHEWAGDAAVREVLAGLGLVAVGTDYLDADVDRLSGGERRRVALAAALVQQADLLVLDEPTNHLDVEGITWLASYLAARRGALIVVTHDRWFLDAVCSRTWEVVDTGVRQFDGGYAAYVLARAERARQADAAEARRQNLLRKELAWLRRGPPARTSKPRFRIDAAEALIADVPPPRSSVELRSLAQKRLGRRVFDVEDVTMRVGERVLLDHLTWHVGPGDRVGLIGVNGSGKTHLLRLLAGEIAPSSGQVRIGQTVHSAHLSQEVTELPEGLRAIEAVREVRTVAELGGVELSATQLAERFGFDNDRQWTPVADLSGGERRRLQLLRLLLAQPNVLLLDEPTNDLDTDTLAALEDLLDSWAGTLVVVSHDRYLLERVCDTIVALVPSGSGATVAALPGGVDEYLARRASSVAVMPAGGRRERRGDSSVVRDSREARKELTRLERRIAALEKREAALHSALAEHASPAGYAPDGGGTPIDFARVAELDAELRAVLAEREAAEESWLELSDDG
ncbi:MAG: ABC-F family ATP-binding cassette domain-containing protein [Jatrophihabitantaceae bacterium]